MIVMTNDVKNMHLAFIGCGVMGESMIAGLLRKGIVGPQKVWASHPRAARREELSEKYGIKLSHRLAQLTVSLLSLTPRDQHRRVA